LDVAARDFSAAGNEAICSFSKAAAASDDDMAGPPTAGSDAAAAAARERLVPWIVGPNQYVIEGCHHQARYVCQSDSCRREGRIEAQRPFVELTASTEADARFAETGAHLGAQPSGPDTSASRVPDAPVDSADAQAVRTTLEAHRSELASCVERTPFGVKVDYAPGAPLAAALRGDLHGKPEEACVRDVLKGVGALPLKSAGMLIHVVK
jgi:hypothetical protein